MHGNGQDVELSVAVGPSVFTTRQVFATARARCLDDVHIRRQGTIAFARQYRPVVLLALHLHLNRDRSNGILELVIIGMIAWRCHVCPAAFDHDRNDVLPEGRVSDDRADASDGEVGRASDGFEDDFGWSIEASLDRMDREFLSERAEHAAALFFRTVFEEGKDRRKRLFGHSSAFGRPGWRGSKARASCRRTKRRPPTSSVPRR